GLVALDIHVHVGGARLRDLPDPVGAGRVLGGGHDRGNPELRAGGDHLVGIGRDQQIGEIGRAPRRLEDVDDQRLAGNFAQDLPGQARGLKPRRNHAEDGERSAHGKARSVRSCAARASAPPGANGTMTGWVRPARANSVMRSRQTASDPTTPRPSRNLGVTCFTAPARSPALQAAFTAFTSSTKPALRKKLAQEPTVAYPG